MITLELLARIAVGWLVLSVIVFGAYVVAMALRNSRRERTQRITPACPERAPVHPRITQADVDATWLEAWTDVEPADIDTLEQRVYDRLFDELIAIEGLQ